MSLDDSNDSGTPTSAILDLEPAQQLSNTDQRILDAGYSFEYTLRSISNRLENAVSFLEEVRTDELTNNVTNWFRDSYNKNNYPQWLSYGLSATPTGEGVDRNSALDYARDVNRQRFNFQAIAVNGAAYYIGATSDSPLGPADGRNISGRPQWVAQPGSDEFLEIWNTAESYVSNEAGLLGEAATIFNEVFSTLGVDPNLPEDLKEILSAYDRRNGGNLEFQSQTVQNIGQTGVQQGETARQLFLNHMVWSYYVFRSQSDLPPGSPALDLNNFSGPLSDLAQIFKDGIVHKYIISSLEIARLEEEEAQRLAEEAERLKYVGGRTDEAQDLARRAAEIEAGLEGREEEILEELVEAGAGAEEDDLTDAQLAQQRRLAEQTFLLDFLDIYAKENQLRNEKYLSDGGVPHFHMVHGATDTIVNKLMYNPSMAELDKIKTSELSGLTPKIRLFKSSFLPTSDYLMGREIKHEIPFNTNIKEQEITDMLNKPFDRGQGVGIKRFEWRLEGRDPFMARRDIFARLHLYFQSMDEFIKVRRATAPRYADNGDLYDDDDTPLEFRYVDLVNIGMAHPGRSFIWNPEYYKIEAEVGWNMPAGTGDSSTFLSNESREAIRATTMKLHLCASDHDIQINDEGNVTLTIEYLAFQEGLYMGPDSDILSTPERRADRLHALKILTSTDDNSCPQKYIADLEEEFKKKVRRQNAESWGRIINSLYEKDRVFYTKVSSNLLDLYLANSRASAAQPLLEELGLRDSLSNFDAASNSNVNDSPSEDEIESRIPDRVGTENVEDLSDEQSVRESLRFLSYGDDDDSYHLQFFYFGDLLRAALEVIHTDVSPTDEVLGERSKLEQNSRIILGPISYMLNRKSEDDPEQYIEELINDINLADIPISVHYFIDFFLTKVVATERTIYPFLSFIREVSSDLIANAMRTSGGVRNVSRQILQLRTNFFTAEGSKKAGQQERLLSLRNAPRREVTELSPTTDSGELDRQTSYSRVDLDALNIEERPVLAPPQGIRQPFNYMLLYAINTGATQELDGFIENDKLKGIYHFGIGRPEGILKRITFSKTDIPFMREARLEKEFLGEITGLAVLANVYNATIECFGTTMFVPGMKIFVNPVGLSPNFGRPVPVDGKRSASSVLGIGGYHVITKVHSVIESGVFKTTVTAIFESPGASLLGDSGAQVGAATPECGPTRTEITSMIRNLR